MQNSFRILLVILLFTGCGEKPRTVEHYSSISVGVDIVNFKAETNEYSIMIPVGWSTNEEIIDSDTLLYSMQAFPEGSYDNTVFALSINKFNTLSGDIRNEFDFLREAMLTAVSNVRLIDETTISINGELAKTLHFGYEYNEEIIQEEIDILIPFNQNQYYLLTLLSDKNDQIETNFGLMLDCAKTFELNY